VKGTLVLMMNTLGQKAAREGRWDEVPQLEKGYAYQVMNVWTGKHLGCVEGGPEGDAGEA
jgi:alpha-galactosidase